MQYTYPEYHLFQLLHRFDNQHLPLDLFLSTYFRAHKALGSKDRALIAEAVYGMTRWRLLLDHLIGPHTSWEKRYALFKRFQPTSYLSVNAIPLHIRVSFPEALLTLLIQAYEEERATALAQICNTSAPITVRINPLKTSREKMLAYFQENGFEVTACEHSALGIEFKQRAPLSALSAFKEGLFEVQDEASQLIADAIAVHPKDQVLDFCAGSGGKTLGFAHKMRGQGQIYLHDIRPFILEQAKKRLKRAGIHNAQFLNPVHPALHLLEHKMDWVIVDVPCSGTGTLRRNPDQKWKFSLEVLNRLVAQQRAIFERALTFVKPGGKIVYATCSLLKEENENQINHFIKVHPLEMPEAPFQSLPTYGGMDGFFAATFTFCPQAALKTATTEAPQCLPKSMAKERVSHQLLHKE